MSRLFERLIEKRGISEAFLDPKYDDCGKKGELPGVDLAVERIKQAITMGDKILIYGDYDADGITASVLMHDALTLAGAKAVEIMLPDRFKDGYGMSKKCVQFAKEQGVRLVITVDCGSNNVDVIDELKAIGIDTIVTDHHRVLGVVPEAVVVINPQLEVNPNKKCIQSIRGEDKSKAQQKDADGQSNKIVQKQSNTGVECPANMKDLAGVGVAFMVAREMVKQGLIPSGQEKWLLDLVVIGTVCDSMRMWGENRRLCYWGMKVLAKTRRLGLKELMRSAGVKRIDSEAIGFLIGPRLNAAGRMQSAELALKLLMTTSGAEASSLAKQLEDLNRARKQEQKRAVQEIEQEGVGEEKVIVVQGKWHEGVLGIIAGRLVEEYQRPAFVLSAVPDTSAANGEDVSGATNASPEGQGLILKGSGRSFGDFNLAEALARCQDYIIAGGGHAGACGVKIEPGKIADFSTAVNQYYQGLGLVNQERYLVEKEDLTVRKLGQLTLDLMGELERLEPYGEGNAEPVFLLKEVEVMNVAKMGKEQNHLRLTVRGEDGELMKLMSFFAPTDWLETRVGTVVDVWMKMMINDWRGVKNVEGRILNLVKWG